jgi:hypothetical protein
MAHFGSYSTSDSNTGNTVLANNDVVTLGPIQLETAQAITGSVASDVGGTLSIQQSFDGIYWDIQYALITLVGGTPQSFSVPVIAPVAQIVFTNNSGSTQAYLRLFARTFATGRG